ncbi:MAG: glycosyltransferase [Fulvivirga sp.]
MKVLYISYDGMTDPLGQSQVLPYLIGLSKEHQITILSAEKEENLKLLSAEVKSLLAESNIEWQYIKYTKSPPILSTVKDLWYMFKIARKCCFNSGIQIVHCRSYIPMMIGLKLKARFNAKLIFDMRGFWVDERIEGKIWNKSFVLHKILYRYFKAKEVVFLNKADAIIVLTNKAKQIIENWRVTHTGITIIPCNVDLRHFTRKRTLDQAAIKTLNLMDRSPILGYLGSLGTWYMIDEMLCFFMEVKKKFEKSIFLVITKDDPKILLEKSKTLGINLDDIRITAATRAELPELLSLFDVSVFFIQSTFSKQASSPTKQAELLSMGIPIVANGGVGDSDEYFEQDPQIGILINKFSKEEYRRVIAQMNSMLMTDKERIRAVAEEHFDLERGIDMYNKIYNSLT